jgi:uracil-DNA glycosylase
VIVVLGRFAASAVEGQLGVSPVRKLHDRVLVGGVARFVVFLPHPNARAVRSLAHHLSEDELARLREALRAQEATARP